jgi:hypothetical protein
MPVTTRKKSPDNTPARMPTETLPDSSDETDGILHFDITHCWAEARVETRTAVRY